jgi:ATP-binding cassette, subfamily B, bacterial PglK
MFDLITKIYRIFQISKTEMIKYSFLFLFMTIIEILGVSVILLFISELSGLGTITNYELNFSNLAVDNTIVVTSTVLLLVYSLKTFFHLYVQKSIFRFSLNKQYDLINRLFPKALVDTEIMLNMKGASEFVQDIAINTAIVTNKGLIPILKISAECLVFIFLSIFMLLNQPVMTIYIISSFVIFNFIFFSPIRKKLLKIGGDFTQSNSLVIKTVDQAARSWKEILMFDISEFFTRRLKKHSRRFATVATEFSYYNVIPRPIIEFALVLVIVIYIVIFSLKGESNADILGSMVLVGGVGLRLMPAFSNIIMLLGQLKFSTSALTSLSKVNGDLSNRSQSIRSSADLNFDLLEYEDISFSSPVINRGGKLILRDVFLKMSAQKAYCLSGPSGSGKTTLINALLGLLPVPMGEIIVRSKNGESCFDNLKGIVGYVPQQPEIFQGTFEENLILGKFESENKFWETLKLTGLYDLVMSFPDREKTELGDSNVELSVGQKQRLAIARAIMHGKSILVLDEPTSALDLDSEIEIVELLKNLKNKYTILIITHRQFPKTICDERYTIRDGYLVLEDEN